MAATAIARQLWQRHIDRQLAVLRHEIRDTVEKLTADVAAMESRLDSAVPASMPQMRS
jgi:hypothetical protein